MSISCQADGWCPYLFSCNQSSCLHNGIFPLTAYTGIVYFLLPFCVMLSNVGGLSAGIFKVPILMDMLNYPVNQATYISYPIVTGASLANFILLIPKRHPTNPTSLVDFNIVLILIPCVIFGSTLGTILVSLIPLLYQDVILIVAFILFTIFFADKFRNCKPVDVDSEEPLKAKLIAEMSERCSSERYGVSEQGIAEESLLNMMQTKETAQSAEQRRRKAEESKLTLQKLLEQHLEYENSYHFKDIIISFVVFIMFEIISLLSQGKLFTFSYCTITFAISFAALWLIFVIYLIVVYLLISKRMKVYQQIGYTYPIKLNDKMNFAIIAGGGFVGGVLQGVIGLGSGNMMIAALLYVGLDARVTGATSGYQIVFIGMASLIEAISNSELSWLDVGWFLGICFLIGGPMTIVMYKLLEKRPSAPKIILGIILSLCILCLLGIIPNIYLTQKYYGWPYMLDIPEPFCDE